MAKVIVLISTQPEKEKEIAKYLKETHKIKTIYLVDGLYNIVAVISIEQPTIVRKLLDDLKARGNVKTIDILTIREENF